MNVILKILILFNDVHQCQASTIADKMGLSQVNYNKETKNRSYGILNVSIKKVLLSKMYILMVNAYFRDYVAHVNINKSIILENTIT